MKTKSFALLIATSTLIDISGCSYVKSLFPDKEKDYQFTTEIPPLILPDDLKKSQIPGLTPSAPAITASDTSTEAPTEETAYATGTTTEIPKTVDSNQSEESVSTIGLKIERIKLNNSANLLRINTPFIKAWRIVNKALSRKSIEVTNRNQEKKIFTVLYDPDEQELKDYTYWNQISSLFSGAHNNEKIYSIQLEEKNRQTDIVITDKDLKPLSDETSNKLLTLLEESIRADLATK